MFYLAAKRALDIVGALAGLVLLSPLFAWAAWQIKRFDGGPVFYLGERIGQDGKPFRIYKFRTMVLNAASLGPAVTSGGDPRITPIGQKLRHWKVDELPQLINVLKGEMSLVGPRPEAPYYVKLYTPEQRQVLRMKPGITGVASLEYRNESEILQAATTNASLDEVYINQIMPAKLALEMDYFRHRSLLLDLQLIARTVLTILN